MTIHAYAAQAPRAALAAFEYAPAELGPYDVELRITHCGICYSDVHLIDNDWGISSYPLVPGHEIVGTVAAKGSRLRLEVGERVGVGWQRGACLTCEQCLAGRDNDCPQAAPTCVGAHGGFADSIRLDGRFAFRIPEALPSEQAAPLLCAGVTTFAPLRYFDVRPSMRVGVIGIGGLGHLGLQWARAWGCEVTAFSSTPEKEEEARSFGAHRFIASRDPAAMKAAAGSLDFILNTAHGDLDWAAYLGLLRPGGRLSFVGAPPSNLSIHASALFGRRSVSASLIGDRGTMGEMLEFAVRHGVRAKVEVAPMSAVNDAIARVKANQARYRVVLAAGS